MNSRLTNVVARPAVLFTPAEIKEMFLLHTTCFDNASIGQFQLDLGKKDWCLLIRNQEHRIIGYSTIELLFREFAGRTILVLFSGDTLVAQEYRSANALIPAFVQFTEYLARIHPHRDHYWLLITKGYRTYRLLPGHLREFYPTFRKLMPPETALLLHELCIEKFGARFCAATGIIRSDNTHDFLKPHCADVPDGKLQNPDVQFFLNVNPGYRQGDELVCIAPLNKTNILPSWYRRYVQGHSLVFEE